MTEAEWLNCTNPEYMVPVFRNKTSNRKLRLLAVAVCRKVTHLMVEPESTQAIQVAERLADGLVSEQERIESEMSARSVANVAFERWDADYGDAIPPAGITYWAARAAVGAVMKVAHKSVAETISSAGLGLAWSEDKLLVAGPAYWSGIELSGPWSHLIRDVIGNPFKTVSIDPSWQTDQIVQLAQTIYDERAFDRMPVLADALENEGCTDADILAHCRHPVEHVRGCWVVDMLLGKE